jgi:hypothetical protein
LAIFNVAVTSNIDPEESKVANELAQVSVSDKPSVIAHLQSILRQKSNWPWANCEDLDFRFRSDDAPKINRTTVPENQVDLGVGNAARLDNVFDRGSLI